MQTGFSPPWWQGRARRGAALEALFCGASDYASNSQSDVDGTWWQPIWARCRHRFADPLDGANHGRSGSAANRVGAHGPGWTAFRDPAGFTELLHANDPWLTAHDDQDRPIVLRYLKVTFLESPSWISIRELALFECVSNGSN